MEFLISILTNRVIANIVVGGFGCFGLSLFFAWVTLTKFQEKGREVGEAFGNNSLQNIILRILALGWFPPAAASVVFFALGIVVLVFCWA